MLIRRICAWCGRYLGSMKCQCSPHQAVKETISHSICPECLKKALAEIELITAVTNKPNSK